MSAILRFSAGGVIFRRKNDKIEFALILDSYGKWTFAKGEIENKEKPAEAARREVFEEVGLEARPIKLLAKIDYWFKEKGNLVHKYVYYFLMQAEASANLKIQKKEIQAAAWFSPEKAQSILGYKKDSEKLIIEALEFLK